MKAFQLTDWKTSAVLRDVPEPEAGPGEVVLRMGGAGACHSDLHIMHEWTPDVMEMMAEWSLPLTLGHENAGWIEQLGAGVEGFERGQAVVVALSLPRWDSETTAWVDVRSRESQRWAYRYRCHLVWRIDRWAIRSCL